MFAFALFTDPKINGKLNVKTINNFNHASLLSSMTNDHLQGDFLNKLYI